MIKTVVHRIHAVLATVQVILLKVVHQNHLAHPVIVVVRAGHLRILVLARRVHHVPHLVVAHAHRAHHAHLADLRLALALAHVPHRSHPAHLADLRLVHALALAPLPVIAGAYVDRHLDLAHAHAPLPVIAAAYVDRRLDLVLAHVIIAIATILMRELIVLKIVTISASLLIFTGLDHPYRISEMVD